MHSAISREGLEGPLHIATHPVSYNLFIVGGKINKAQSLFVLKVGFQYFTTTIIRLILLTAL